MLSAGMDHSTYHERLFEANRRRGCHDAFCPASSGRAFYSAGSRKRFRSYSSPSNELTFLYFFAVELLSTEQPWRRGIFSPTCTEGFTRQGLVKYMVLEQHNAQAFYLSSSLTPAALMRNIWTAISSGNGSSRVQEEMNFCDKTGTSGQRHVTK